jgi:hypothetical protein
MVTFFALLSHKITSSILGNLLLRDPLRVKATYFLLILIHTASVRAYIKVHYLNSLAAFVDKLEQSGKLYLSNHRKWIGKFDSEPTVDSYGYRRFDSHSV